MTPELALAIAIGLCVAFARAGSVWWACRTPLGRVNFEMARERERRRRR